MLSPHRLVISLATKDHWRDPSRLEWIKTGLETLTRVVHEKQISSIAIPPLGCGNGGLKWATVRPMIEDWARLHPKR
ncbi:macro domain-containing protein, partial [Escherichia coli]|uniref:macro domain-containing protein n=1 Tax=Escherichia coli TaxID=562 RepID=UPI003CCB3676